jgi:choline dehydrogenase-like flavoprotein
MLWCQIESAGAEVTGGSVAWDKLPGIADITGGVVDASIYRFTFRSTDTTHTASIARAANPIRIVIEGPGGPVEGVLTLVPPDQPEAALEGIGDFFQQLLSDDLWRLVKVLAQVLLPSHLPPNGPTAGDVVTGIADFLKKASGKEVKRIRTLLQVIGFFVPVLELGVDAIRELVRGILSTEDNSPVREALAGIHQIVVFAYYSHQSADKMLGYARPVHRPVHRTHLPVTASVPQNRVFDVVIAGTGPAGSLLADRLSSAGKSVLLLEAGPYIPEDEITTNELDSIARLYKSSGLQIASKPSSVTVLQGACVGGGGVINNGLFVGMSTNTLQAWRDIGFPFDATAIGQAYQAVAKDLNIGDVGTRAQSLNPAGAFLETKFGPAQAPPLDAPTPPGFYRMLVNLEAPDATGFGERGCLSTGLCNLGCGSERKVNSYQHYLANALSRSPNVVLVPGATVTRAQLDHGHRATAFEVRQADGKTVLARGREFILSCGPVASSGVLLRSDHLPPLPVGRRFSGNVASPLFARAPHPVNSKPSVQMCQVFVPEAGSGFLLETWFTPPGGLALAMPGFLETHAGRMANYANLLGASPVIGTQPIGRITLKGDDTVIDLPLAPVDLDRFRRGMVLLLQALLAGGATPIIVRIGSGRVVANDADIARLDAEMRAIQPDDLHLLPLSTAHPQGGNALSNDARIAVVGADFRVRGVDNLRVCDGSVFPMGCDVNPQWTIFALAHLCAAGM